MTRHCSYCKKDRDSSYFYVTKQKRNICIGCASEENKRSRLRKLTDQELHEKVNVFEKDISVIRDILRIRYDERLKRESLTVLRQK